LGFSSFKQFLQRIPEIVTFVDHDRVGHLAKVESAVDLAAAVDDQFAVSQTSAAVGNR